MSISVGTAATRVDELSRDECFEVLSSRRRRHTLHYLTQQACQVSVGDVARQVAAWENGVDLAEVTSTERKRVYTSLRQVHLPKMERLNVVEYESSRGLVSLTDLGANLQVYLEVVPENEIAWSTFYFGLSAVATLVSVLAFVGFPPFSLLPGIAWALLISLAFAGTAAANVHDRRRSLVGGDGIPPEADGLPDASTEARR